MLKNVPENVIFLKTYFGVKEYLRKMTRPSMYLENKIVKLPFLPSLRRGGLLSFQEVRQHINRERKHNSRVLLGRDCV